MCVCGIYEKSLNSVLVLCFLYCFTCQQPNLSFASGSESYCLTHANVKQPQCFLLQLSPLASPLCTSCLFISHSSKPISHHQHSPPAACYTVNVSDLPSLSLYFSIPFSSIVNLVGSNSDFKFEVLKMHNIFKRLLFEYLNSNHSYLFGYSLSCECKIKFFNGKFQRFISVLKLNLVAHDQHFGKLVLVHVTYSAWLSTSQIKKRVTNYHTESNLSN